MSIKNDLKRVSLIILFTLMKIIKENILYIYTDGSSYSGPRHGGIGILYVFFDSKGIEQAIPCDENGYKEATNNEMELMAVLEGLKQTRHRTFDLKYNYIEVRTDSSYVRDNYKRAFYWSKQKWVSKEGKPYDNAEIWKELIKLIPKLKAKVEVIWIKGHGKGATKDEYNDAVDKLAKKSANSPLINPSLSISTNRRKKTKEKTKIGNVIHTSQPIAIRIVMDKLLKMQDIYKYRYEVIEETSPYFGCITFAYSDKSFRAGHSYLVVFNQNPKNSRILKLITEIGKPKNPSPAVIRALEGI